MWAWQSKIRGDTDWTYGDVIRNNWDRDTKWHEVDYYKIGNNHKVYYDVEKVMSSTLNTYETSFNRFLIQGSSHERASGHRYDDVKVRKYTSPEPSVSLRWT